jgi:hypothetical protein
MSDALFQTLRDLADARSAQVALDEQAKAAKVAFETANALVLGDQKKNAALVAKLEGEVRALGLNAYHITKKKEPAPGLEIKISRVFSYTEAEALAWAKKTGMCLIPEALDKSAFEKVAKATTLPFGSFDDVPKVFIGSQLNAALYLEPATEAIAS